MQALQTRPKVIPFSFHSNELRVLERDGEPWFVAMDIAEVLGYSDAQAMTRRLDDDETQNLQIVGFGNRGATVINESGMYSAILGSTKPEAKAFKKWVTSEVLPTIRKTGGYQMPRPALDKKEVKDARGEFFEVYRELAKQGHDHFAALSMADDAVRTATGYSFLEAGNNPHLTRQLASELRENPERPERLLIRSQQVTLDIAVNNCARSMDGLSFQVYHWLCEVMDVVAQERIPRHRLVEALNLLKVKKTHEIALAEMRRKSCPVCGGLPGVAQ